MTEVTKAPPLPPAAANFQEAEFSTKTMRASIPPGVGVERLMDPDYWVHVARNVKAGYIIQAIAQDGRYFAELLVRKTGPQDVFCWLLRHVDLDGQVVSQRASAPDAGAEYRVEWGGKHKWRVVRSDGEVIHRDEPSKPDADLWLATHLGKVTA